MGVKADKATATRRRLVDVAHELFSERGYEGTSIDDVLARAGVSKGALYHHFDNKEALFEAVYRDGEQACLEEVAAAAMKESEPLQMLRAGSQKWLDLVMEPAIQRVALIDAPAVLGWERWRAIDQEYAGGLVRAALEKAIEAGAIPRQNVELLAHMALAMLGEAAMLIARSDDPARARVEAGEAVDRLIEALAREPG